MLKLYKRYLLSDVEKLQLKAIVGIRAKFKNIKRRKERRKYSKILIDKEIAWILCHITNAINKKISRSSILILKIMSNCKEFFTINIARRAITYILQKGNQLADNNDNDEYDEIIVTICITLDIIFYKANRFDISINTICDIDGFLKFIVKLPVKKILQPSYRVAVIRLYSSVLNNIDNLNDDKRLNIISQFHIDIVDVANEITKNYIKNGDRIYQKIIASISVICYTVLRFSKNIIMNDDNTSRAINNINSNKYIDLLRKLFHATRKTLLENVIPNSINIDFTIYKNEILSRNLFNSLCELYKRHDIDLKEFSWALVKYGYLKYLYKMTFKYKSYYDDICQVFAKIAMDTSDKHLAMDQWSTGHLAFYKFIKFELLTLKNSLLLNNNLSNKDGVLFIIFIHFHNTTEFNIIDFIEAIAKLNITMKIINMPSDIIIEVPTLQVILFLFSVSVLNSPLDNINELFYIALPRLIDIVHKAGIKNCYTYSRTFPLLVLENSLFPEQMPDDVLKIWLKFNNNIYALFTPGQTNGLIDYIWSIIQTEGHGLIERCPWRHRRTLNISVMSVLPIRKQIKQAIWANFIEVITDYYTKEHENNVELYLNMINPMRIGKLFTLQTVIEYSKAIISCLIEKSNEMSINIKILLTQQASKMLHLALISNNNSVVQLFVDNYDILEKLIDQAFNKDSEDLSTISFECLAAILRAQLELSTQCMTPISLCHTKLHGPLMPRKSNYYDIMEFYDRLWVEKLDRPAVILAPHRRRDIKDTLIEIYRMYCVIHINADKSFWDCTFHCMANFLIYLSINNRSALSECCEYICNSNIIIEAIEYNYSSTRFFDFLTVWMRMSVKRYIPSVHRALLSRNDRREIKERIFHESPFLTAVYAINNYINTKALALDYVKQRGVTELMSYIIELV